MMHHEWVFRESNMTTITEVSVHWAIIIFYDFTAQPLHDKQFSHNKTILFWNLLRTIKNNETFFCVTPGMFLKLTKKWKKYFRAICQFKLRNSYISFFLTQIFKIDEFPARALFTNIYFSFRRVFHTFILYLFD